MSFDVFGLHTVLLDNLRNAKLSTPTPVQEQAIPPVLEGLDVMACAQTGTGKTLAFVLPSLHRLMSARPRNNGNGPRLLVLTPTRELAQQVAASVKLLAPADRLRVGVVVGGMPYPPQNRLLSQRLDVLVATPGRLIDHLQEGRVDLSRVDVLVLDEADRMLDMGFQKPVERIVAEIPAERQTLLFSATFSDGVRKIGRQLQNSPVMIELAPVIQRHDNIEQSVIRVDDRSHKLKVLETLLNDGKVWQAIVFVGTKRYADTLAEKLNEREIACAALHGDMRQSARRRTLDAMHRGTLRVLVATDVAARGIDVKDLSHVFNFDLPQVAEDYVHRIGRTGRAGATGEAVSLVSPQDAGMLREIEKLMGTHIERRTVEGLESRQSNAEFMRQADSAPKGKGRGGKPQGNRSAGGNSRFGSKFGKSERSASAKPAYRSESRDTRSPRRDESLDSGWGSKSSVSKGRSFTQSRDDSSYGSNWSGGNSASSGRGEGRAPSRRDDNYGNSNWSGKSASAGRGRGIDTRSAGGRRDDTRSPSRRDDSYGTSNWSGKSASAGKGRGDSAKGSSWGGKSDASSASKTSRFGKPAGAAKKAGSSWGKPQGDRSRGSAAAFGGGNKSSLRRRGAHA